MPSIQVEGSNNQVAGRDLIVQPPDTAHRQTLLHRQEQVQAELLAVSQRLRSGRHRWLSVLPLIVGMAWGSLGLTISGEGALFLFATTLMAVAYAKGIDQRLQAHQHLLLGDLEALRRQLLIVP